jgi:FkbM family methyltransferase
VTLHKHTFDWSKMKGSKEALKWNCRDLTSIDAILQRVIGRSACVQAGGNLGVFGKYLAKFFAQVLVFEPAPELFPSMTANAPEPNILRYQAALGEAPGLVSMACSRRGAKKAPVHEGLTHVAGDGIVPVLRLDDFALPALDLLMLDLEGFELFALKGAAQTVLRCRPVIAVEVNQNSSFYGVSRDDVRDWIAARRYQLAFRIQSDEVFVPCH